MPICDSDALWQRAEARWAEIEGTSPDLQATVALQRRILRLIFDAYAALDIPDQAVPTNDEVLARWKSGVPALRNHAIAIPEHLRTVLPPICEALADAGAGESALHIWEALVSGQIDAGSLLSVSLKRDRHAIRTSALHMGFAPDLLWLIGELASSPLAYALQQHLLRDLKVADLKVGTTSDKGQDVRTADLQVGLTAWDRGYCPICGSWPAFIESISRTRSLRCSYCAAPWSLRSHRCAYCGNASDTFVTAAPDLARKDRRLDMCSACGGYTKVIDVSDPTPFPLLAIEDLATMDLDQAAMSREYGRPELFDLDART